MKISKKFIIIGGSGFIGTALCRQLDRESVPFQIIDLKLSSSFPERTRIADIRDVEAMREHIDGDIIIHLAAVHRDNIRDRNAYFDTNVEGTRVISKVAEEKGISRIVFTSTVAVYGFAPAGTGETGAIQPFNAYGKSKFEAEEALRAWARSARDQRGLIIVRPTVVFGPGNRGNVYNLLDQIARRRFVMVGKGLNRKSMAYVENVAQFIITAANSSLKKGLFNYVDDPDMDMNEFVNVARRSLLGKKGVGLRVPFFLGLAVGHFFDAFARLTGLNFPLSSIRVRKFCASTSFSSAKHDLDGFVPLHSLRDALHRTLEAEFVVTDTDMEIFFTE
jgi:nucleoside-diphosphate-sugar epimerase